jgi:hypothetical protein
MYGTKVEFFFHNRDHGLVVWLDDITAKEMERRWSIAVHTQEKIQNLTDKNGSRITVQVDRVEMMICTPWNGV